jgi:hypothetical protein
MTLTRRKNNSYSNRGLHQSVTLRNHSLSEPGLIMTVPAVAARRTLKVLKDLN